LIQNLDLKHVLKKNLKYPPFIKPKEKKEQKERRKNIQEKDQGAFSRKSNIFLITL
jgi:hypothetical protein